MAFEIVKEFVHRLRYDKGYRNIFVSGFTCLLAAYTVIYPYSFLPDMIKWMGYKEEEKAFYTGIIASAYFAGKSIFSGFWGWLSDKKGRKSVLMFLLIGTGITCLLFAFCTNIYTSVLVRFLDGIFNCVLGSTRAFIHDSTDKDNQAFGMTVVMTFWGVGCCLGPLIGGVLSSPADKYPETFSQDGLFGRYPFAIPSIFGFVLAFTNACVVFFFATEKGGIDVITNEDRPTSSDRTDIILLLDRSKTAYGSVMTGNSAMILNEATTSSDRRDETLPVDRNKIAYGSATNGSSAVIANKATSFDISDETLLIDRNKITYGSATNGSSAVIPNKATSSDISDETLLIDRNKITYGSETNDAYIDEDEIQHRGVEIHNNNETDKTASNNKQTGMLGRLRSTAMIQLLSDKTIVLILVINCTLSFGFNGLWEIFPAWCSTDRSFGGLGFSSSEIALALSTYVLAGLILQSVFMIKYGNRFGYITLYTFFVLVMSFDIQIMPMSRLITISPWIGLVITGFIFSFSYPICQINIGLISNNIAPKHLVGAMNGLFDACVYTTLSLSPITTGYLFSSSITSDIGPPFDASTSFVFSGSVLAISAYLSFMLPRYLNQGH